ncbi:MAG: polynucleotide adenylyltransferase PcnB [Advenella sp.]
MIKSTIKSFVNRLFNSPASDTKKTKARVYHQEQHGIDRRLVSRNAIKVCEVLNQKGFQAFIVGGAVRDLILGLEPKDFDVATNATPEAVRACFRRARIIGRRFQLVHVVFGPEIIETSTFRANSNGQNKTDEHGRILNDNVFGTQEEDAARRDFTLNALYYDPLTEQVIDYHNGLSDLRKHLVRIIGDPETRYREDPVRMLRAVRFAAKLNGTIEPHTKEPIKQLAELISNVPDSRLFDETLKLMTCGNALACLKQLREEGLHEGTLPLLDVVLKQPGGQKFVELTLDRTDHRVRLGKSVSPSFLYAALLWRLVDVYWKRNIAQKEPPMQALIHAADQVLEDQVHKLAIQRRHTTDMREIWFMQPRFERPVPRQIWKMTEQPRFRAACDFLQLRAASGEFDSVQAQWWMDLADTDAAGKIQMIEELAQKQKGMPATAANTARKRRKRRSPARKKAALPQQDIS